MEHQRVYGDGEEGGCGADYLVEGDSNEVAVLGVSYGYIPGERYQAVKGANDGAQRVMAYRETLLIAMLIV